jgi:hypothetical protein
MDGGAWQLMWMVEMNRLEMRRWTVALMAGGGIAAAAPAGAEVVYVSDSLAPLLAAVPDATMRMQLCARKDVDGSCLDGRTSNKARRLAPSAPPDDPLPTDPLDLGNLPPVITHSPPVIDELPKVGDEEPLLPVVAQPTSIAVPEPGSLSLGALGALMLVTVMQRMRSNANRQSR